MAAMTPYRRFTNEELVYRYRREVQVGAMPLWRIKFGAYGSYEVLRELQVRGAFRWIT